MLFLWNFVSKTSQLKNTMKATNVVMNYTETEAKVREATNDDPWGPSGTQMNEIARLTFM